MIAEILQAPSGACLHHPRLQRCGTRIDGISDMAGRSGKQFIVRQAFDGQWWLTAENWVIEVADSLSDLLTQHGARAGISPELCAAIMQEVPSSSLAT